MHEKNNLILEKFGKILIKEVFDASLERLNNIVDGNVKAPKLLTLHQELKNVDKNNVDIMRNFAKECIQNTLHNFLWMIEQSDGFDLVAKIDDQTTSLKEISDGLCGELYTKEGWIEKYSKYPPTIT